MYFNLKKINLDWFASAMILVLQPQVVLASTTMKEMKQIDPNPSESFQSHTNLGALACSKLCQQISKCKAYYWVPNEGWCWLKDRVHDPEYKSFEQGVGGIKIKNL